MATVNKNFRVKNGLIVEGSTATVNGQNILTETGSDNYIINLIGGTATSANTGNTVVKRDASGNFSAGTITATLTGNVTGNLTGNVTGNLTGDVTGTVSSLSNHDTDSLAEGDNLYYTAARAKEEAANLLVNATKTNIQISKDGSNNLTITAENGVADSDTDDLAEGTTNLYFTNTRARQALSGGTGISYNDATGVISVDNTIATKSYADNAADDAETAANGYTDTAISTEVSDRNSAITAAINTEVSDRNSAITAAINTEVSDRNNAITSAVNALDTDDIEEGGSNLYFTNGRARNAVSAGTGITYNAADGIINVSSNTFDAWGAASAAEAAAASYTDDAIDALTTSVIEEGTNLYYTDTRARGAVSAGSGLTYNSGTGAFAVDTTIIANKTYVDNAITALVDGAPGLLDTLNEIAAAINDDANYFTTVANNIAAKLSLSGGTLTGALTLHADPSSNLHAATKQYVDAAEAAAQAAAEATAQASLDNVLNGSTDFTALDVNSVSRQVAATTGNIATAATTTALSWSKTEYRTAKILVKAKNGSHTHFSEVIVTLDTSDNIALNEYAITTTNGSLMTIDADIDSGNVRLRVTPAHNNTEVMVHATLLV